MGATCCTAPNQMPDAPRKESMVLYADFFDSDTRTLLAMTQITQADLKHEQVDKSKAAEAASGTTEDGGPPAEATGDEVAEGASAEVVIHLKVPRLAHGLKTINGSGGQWQEMFEYFFEQSFIAKRTFCPQEYKTAIDQQATWFKQSLKPNVDALLANV